MFKNKVKVAAALAAMALVGGGLTSCSLQAEPLNCEFGAASTEKEITQEVAVVEGPTSNFANFQNVIDEAKVEIRTAISEDGSQLTVVIADAQPKLISTSFTAFGDLDTEADKDNVRKRAIGPVSRVSNCAVVKNNPLELEQETDVLASLGVAADTFTVEDSKKEIFMLSNGLQSTGQYPMQTRGIPTIEDAPAVVAQLKEAKALPDLKGATVNWVGLGLTDGKTQRKLNQQTLDALENFWTLVIEASNGEVGKISRQVPDGKPSKNAITVSQIAGMKNACFFTLGQEAGFSFTPDSATFIDESVARSGAFDIVSKFNAAGCSGELFVTGYVASGVSQDEYVPGNAANTELSLQRAEAFKALLESEGISGKVTAIGGGKGPDNDWNPDGSFNEEAGKLNRIVVISQ